MTNQQEWQNLFPEGTRYQALGPALRGIFGRPTARVALDAGFTCPTRDGTKGTGGCLYCDAAGARSVHVDPDKPIAEQLREGIERLRRRRGADAFVAYFQAFTNTYAPPERLRVIYEEGLSERRVVAMAIGTRPDCLPDETLEVLEEYSRRTFLWLEVGLQSTRNSTLAAMRRGHTIEEFLEVARRLRERSLRFAVHLIFGLPGDSAEDMIAAADILNEIGAWGVKVHNLYVDDTSPLALSYQRGELPLFSREQYIEILVEFLRRLSPHVIIHRLMGEAPAGHLVAPAWSADKSLFLEQLRRRMKDLGAWQGDRRLSIAD